MKALKKYTKAKRMIETIDRRLNELERRIMRSHSFVLPKSDDCATFYS